MVAVLLANPAIAKEPNLAPTVGGAYSSEAQKLPSGQEALTPKPQKTQKKQKAQKTPKVTKPSNDKHNLDPKLTGTVKLPPTINGTRVPLDGTIPIIDIPNRVKPPSPLPPPVIRNDGTLPGAISRQPRLRINGQNRRVDLRGMDSANGMLEWNAPNSTGTLLIISKDWSVACPGAGTNTRRGVDHLRTDPSVITYFEDYNGPRGRSRHSFNVPAYYRITDVYFKVCGISGGVNTGIASNVVHVQLGTVNRNTSIRPSRWSVAWSMHEDANPACSLGGLETHALLPQLDGHVVGFETRTERGADPVPCIRTKVYRYRTSAGFDLTTIPRDARITSAHLLFGEVDGVTHVGGLCRGAADSAGLAATPITPGVHHVDTMPRNLDGLRSTYASASFPGLKAIDVSDWVRIWLDGRAADVTFLERPIHGGLTDCYTWLRDVKLHIEYE